MVEDFFTLLGYLIGAVSLIGGVIVLGMILVGAIAAIYQLGAWIINGIRD